MQKENEYFVGKRKNAVAVTKIMSGTGNVFVNGKNINEYFKNNAQQINKIYLPFKKCDVLNKFDIIATTKGGGVTGQSEALRHSVALALAAMDLNWKKVLKKEGLLKRDSRVVERKKPGRPKARKRFQFSKR